MILRNAAQTEQKLNRTDSADCLRNKRAVCLQVGDSTWIVLQTEFVWWFRGKGHNEPGIEMHWFLFHSLLPPTSITTNSHSLSISFKAQQNWQDAPNDLCSAPKQNAQNAHSSKQNTDNKWSCSDRAINEHNQKDNIHCKCNCATDGGNMYYCE